MGEYGDDDKPAFGVVEVGKREADIAAELKAETLEAMKPVLEIMQRAAGHGLLIGWENIGTNQFGRYQINGIKVVKHY